MKHLCKCNCGTEIPLNRVFAVDHNKGARSRKARFERERGRVVGECDTCDIPLISDIDWRRLSDQERVGKARRGKAERCNRCYKAALRAQDPNKVEGRRARTIHAEEMLEEWDLLRSDGVTDLTVAAARIGTTRGALQKCLERARHRGDGRAVVYTNQQLGGATQGRTGWTSRGRYAA